MDNPDEEKQSKNTTLFASSIYRKIASEHVNPMR